MPLQLQPFFRHIKPPNQTPSTNLIPPKPLNPLQTPPSSPSSPPIDHLYISQLLSRPDWAVLLNHDLSSKTLLLNPSYAVSIFQNQQNPSHAIKFHSWLSHVNPTLAAHNSVHRALRNTLHRKGPALLSVDLLRELRNLGFRVTEDLLCALLASWGRLGLANYSAHVFCQISFLGLSPTTRLYNALIDALVKSNSIDLAYLKFQQMAADNCVADRFTYNTLIHGVCKVGVVDEALRLVRQMKDKGHFPNVFTYTMLIEGFCIASRVDEAFGVFETMKDSGVYPNEATVRALVHGVFRCVDPSKALELLSEFLDREQEQERVHFMLACDTVLYCLANNSMAKEMVVFLRRVLGRGGYFPGNSVFNVVMACLVKGAELRETCDVFEILRKQGVKAGIGAYLALIEVLYKNEWREEGDRVYGQLISDGLISNVFSYNMIINCFCRAKLMDNASEAFRDMQVRGVVPNLVTFNTLINGHCKDGAIDKARKLLESLLENGLKPDIFTFSSIVDGLCQIKRTEEALECFTEMIEWGINPNAVIYNILIRSLCTIGDVARSVKLLRRMQKEGISPDTYSYNALIQIFCRMNKVEKAKKLFDSMSRSGLNPDNYTYSAFIEALSESGRLEEAKKMFYSMEANGCCYIIELLKLKRVQVEYGRSGLNPDNYTYNALWCASESGRLEEAEKMFYSMQENGCSPDSYV
ncbi:putative pentatricopeptide repeat-containing protein, mitochondrial [Glycine max]|nr:putative pentatricopeptide repeat-containing protein, mitochondrial [Glycine max]